MDEHTAVTLAVQLIALCSVVSALVLYLLCKVRSNRRPSAVDFVYRNVGGGRAVLITSIDNLLGLHLAYHLATRGFRVFAGVKPSGLEADERPDVSDTVPKRILESKCKEFEACCEKETENVTFGSAVVLPLDVTREDLLHDAVGTIRRYLPAGEDGLWAVMNTAGVPCRGFEGQDGTYWDTVMRLYVTGTLKVSRTFMPLLRTKKGRLINLGAQVSQQEFCSSSLAAHTAGRYAVEGASAALRNEMRPLGVKVVTLQPEGLPIARLFATPLIPGGAGAEAYVNFDMKVLPDSSLHAVEDALLCQHPHDSYALTRSPGIFALTNRLFASRPLQLV